MKNTNQKGFTIVELVIVIAVVSVLAAVLIPSFTEIVANAQMAKDIALYRNIQTIIEAEAALGNDVADYDKAMEILRENGIDDIRTTNKDCEIRWDDDSRSFVMSMSGDQLADTEQIAIDESPGNGQSEEDDGRERFSVSTHFSSDELTLSSESSNPVSQGDTYTATLTVPYTLYLTTLKITMGNDDVTDTCTKYEGKNIVIEIENVNADIEITAETVVNQVRISQDLYDKYTYGNTDNGYNDAQTAHGPGYLDNHFISTSTNQNGICATEKNGIVATGWMLLPWELYDEIVIRIYNKDGSLYPMTNNDYKYHLSDQIKFTFGTYDIKENAVLIDSNYLIITLNKSNHSDYNYFRFSAPGLGATLVVTFNEPIFPEEE